MSVIPKSETIFSIGTSGTVIYSGKKVCYSVNAQAIEVKTSKRKNKKIVLYPDFGELKQFTDETFWLDILDKCMSASLSKEYKFSDDNIFYKKGKKSSSFKISEFTNEKFLELKKFLFDTSGIESPRESEAKHKLIKCEKCQNLDFRQIKACGKKLKVAIAHYLSLESKKNNLSHFEIIVLESLVRNGISGGMINEKCVILENNMIVCINNISYSCEERKYYLADEILKITKSNKRKKNDDDDAYSSFSQGSVLTAVEDTKSDKLYFIKAWTDFCIKTFGKKKE